MTDFVLIISIGPVQGFISAARRSRDLWSGSWLLSEISKAAALSLRDQGARLVFPAPDADLTPGSELSVGNKVQAVLGVPQEAELRTVVVVAQQAARLRFRELAEQARHRLRTTLRAEVWDSQLDDYVEAFSGWAAMGEVPYGVAADRAASALAARKATREFSPSAITPEQSPFFGLPKSSLDGARETVLSEDSYVVRRKLSLSGSEQLDCAGITKRLSGDIEQFTPMSRIAAHGWITSLPQETLARLSSAYETAVKVDGLATRVSGNAGEYKDLAYDGQFLYRPRLDTALRDALESGDSEAAKALQGIRKEVKPIWKRYGEPCPYCVILLADGDRMGALLNEVDSEAHHVRITQALSEFAGKVRGRVREFQGHAIYAGGDDVLAFLPLHKAFKCAQALQQDFAAALQLLAQELGARNRPTLSVGLAIGHMMEPLGTLRALAGRAERLAKGDGLGDKLSRNALAICLKTRGGGETAVRLRWDDAGALADFSHWQSCYEADQRRLPSRVAYDARAVHLRTAFTLGGAKAEPGIQEAEFLRLLDRARNDDGTKLPDEMKARLTSRYRNIGLSALADELIVARWLAARLASDLGDQQ
jgi:CRISPR-associated protein Cmr2